MKNCLVTTYKATVNNDELPFYNAAIVNFKQNASATVYVETFPNKTVEFETDATLNFNYGTNPITNGAVEFTVNTSASDVSVKIKNTNNIRKIRIDGFDTTKSIENIYTKALGILLNITENDVLKERNNLLCIGRLNNVSQHYAEEVVGNNGHTLIIIEGRGVHTSIFPNDAVLEKATGLIGDISLAPITIKQIAGVSSEPITGNIEDFVTRARTAGRTSGVFYLNSNPTNFPNLKYNNTALSTYMTSQGLDGTASVYVKWDNSTITFSNSKPSEYVNPQSFYNI